MEEFLMLIEKTNDAQAEALKHDAPTLQDQYQVIQTERLVLLMHYQILYKQYQALLERCPTKQEQYPDVTTFRQTLQDYRQSQQEHRRLIRQFRQTMHKHLIMRWSYQSDQNSRIQADRPHIRKTILLGAGNEKDAAFLKESMQQTGAHRVFVVTDSSQVLCLVQNVHIDLLVLDDGLTPLPGIELYHHLHCMKGLEATPAIIMSDCFKPLLQAELALYNLIGLEKPIKVDALVKAIDQLLV
jgi:CheY-like chemotaxis protein